MFNGKALLIIDTFYTEGRRIPNVQITEGGRMQLNQTQYNSFVLIIFMCFLAVDFLFFKIISA